MSPGPEKRKQEKYPGDKCLLGQVVVSVVVVSSPIVVIPLSCRRPPSLSSPLIVVVVVPLSCCHPSLVVIPLLLSLSVHP
jgi:hypothetical protein